MEAIVKRSEAFGDGVRMEVSPTISGFQVELSDENTFIRVATTEVNNIVGKS